MVQKHEVQALINFNSKVNAMIPAYTLKLNLQNRQTNLIAQKLHKFTLETFIIVLTNFWI